jgi:site-specific recombinase XerD
VRHSFASLAVNNRASLYEVQQLLGHANSKMTERYAHLAQANLRKVSAKVAETVEATQGER